MLNIYRTLPSERTIDLSTPDGIIAHVDHLLHQWHISWILLGPTERVSLPDDQRRRLVSLRDSLPVSFAVIWTEKYRFPCTPILRFLAALG